jgi:TolB protein
MILRVFRLSDRIGQVILLICAQSGLLILRVFDRWRIAIKIARAKPMLSIESIRVESQVRSLSGLTVVLLAGLTALLLWSTGLASSANPIISFFSFGQQSSVSDISAANTGSSPQNFDSASVSGTLVVSMWAGAQQDLFAVRPGQPGAQRLTDSPYDDQHPAWSPDGQRIAFSSRRDGNWDLYVLYVPTGELIRLTHDPVYEAAPAWSPDGQWLVYEGYYEGNLDIYIVRADSSEGPYPVTRSPSAEFSPSWRNDSTGREIAYVSTRDGNQDIYVLSLDNPREDLAINVTNTPDIQEDHPVWGQNGRALAYDSNERGIDLVNLAYFGGNEPVHIIGQGHSPAWSPDGSALAFVTEREDGTSLLLIVKLDTLLPVQTIALSGIATHPSWSTTILPDPLQGSLAFAATTPIEPAYTETMVEQQGLSRLVNLTGVVAESQPALSEKVDESFVALRNYMNRNAGWDILGRLGQVWWKLDRPVEPGQPFENWHKAGRAFDLVQEYNQGEPAQIEIIKEQLGAQIYWHVYVRCAVQDGTMGEPLKSIPWDLMSRFRGDVSAYEAGGKLKSTIPSGYYIDFTQVASIFGWRRVPSDDTWRYNWPGIAYWQYEKHGDMEWWTAMQDIYPELTLRQAFSTPMPEEIIGLPDVSATPPQLSPTAVSPTSESTPLSADN